jgi:hypothetical protein
MRKSRWPAATSDADFAPYLAGAPEPSVIMFRRFIDLARAAGPVTFELQDGPVVLCGTRRIFAGVHVGDHGLAGRINLTRRLTDRRITKSERLTSTLISNLFLVTSLSELDETFAQWLREGRDVGDGAHLSREIPRP